jgi:ATPase subunit of ABC transporter with duplicated ATPase domains
MWIFHQQMLHKEQTEKEKREQEAKKQQQRELRKKQAEELRKRRSFRDDDTASKDESTYDEEEEEDEESDEVSDRSEKNVSTPVSITPRTDTFAFHSKPFEQVAFAIEHVAKGFINIEGYRIISGVCFQIYSSHPKSRK